MPNHHSVLAATKTWFETARPESTNKDIHSQLGCHFEEVAEMIDEITPCDITTNNLLVQAREAIHNLAEHLKAGNDLIEVREENRIGMIDAICDQLVTATGVAHTLEMDPVGGLGEVNRSNYSKFDETGKPIRNPDTGKIMKGPNYRPADLSPYI